MEATGQGHAPNVPAMNKAFIGKQPQDGAMAIVSGEVAIGIKIAMVNALGDEGPAQVGLRFT